MTLAWELENDASGPVYFSFPNTSLRASLSFPWPSPVSCEARPGVRQGGIAPLQALLGARSPRRRSCRSPLFHSRSLASLTAARSRKRLGGDAGSKRYNFRRLTQHLVHSISYRTCRLRRLLRRSRCAWTRAVVGLGGMGKEGIARAAG